MNALETINLARTADFQARIQFLTVKAAKAVMLEDAGTPLHAERVVLAKKLILGTIPILAIALLCLTIDEVVEAGSGVTDALLAEVIADNYNAFI